MIDTACIFNIQRYSLHDGGGIRTIVFFKGCPFSCPWCCNPESLSSKPQLFYKESLCMKCSKKENGICSTPIEDCPTGAKELVGEEKSVDAIYDIVKRDYAFYESSNGGVTLSGGEFLLQENFAISLLEKCKEHNIHTAVETTMAIPVKQMQKLVEVCDLFLIDFKIWDEEKSKEILHLDINQVKINIKEIQKYHGEMIARIPLIPHYTVDESNLNKIMSYLKEIGIKDVHLLPFHRWGEAKYRSIQKDYGCTNLKPLTEKSVNEIQKHFQVNGFQTLVHG